MLKTIYHKANFKEIKKIYGQLQLHKILKKLPLNTPKTFFYTSLSTIFGLPFLHLIPPYFSNFLTISNKSFKTR